MSSGGLGWLWVFLLMAFTFAIGFLLGTRAKQMLAAVQMSVQAVMSLKELLKAAGATEEDNNGADDADDVDEDEGDDGIGKDLLEQCMSTDVDYGLDDHADVVRNPIILYQVKQSKDTARREKRRLALIAEGIDEDVVNQMMEDEALGIASGGVGDGQRQNALALLIAAGARVKPLDGAGGAEAAAADERRRAARTIDVFLSKDRGIDVKKTYREKSSTTKNKSGPLEVALKTKDEPYGGTRVARASKAAQIAKSGRIKLKKLHMERKKQGLDFVVPEERRDGRQGAALLTAADQKALLAELGDEVPDFADEDDGRAEDDDDEEDGGESEADEDEELAA